LIPSPRNLDYFGARYYAPTLGCFMTPDWSATPEAGPYASLQNPQSLNLYSYVLNNPTTSTDPDGHWCDFGWGSSCSKGAKLQPKEGGVAGAAGADALAGGLDTAAILDGLKALGDAATTGATTLTEGALGTIGGLLALEESLNAGEDQILARGRSEQRAEGQPASEQTAKDMAAQIERDLGADARRDFHDAKGPGRGDRTLGELREDAKRIYREYGRTPPKWMRPGGGQ
jgi:RHS repeat-associated protein